MKYRLGIVLSSTFACALTGCATQRSPVAPTARPTTAAISAPSPSDPTHLTLDEIEPRPVLVTQSSTTSATTRPSLDAIQFFAEARAATLDGQRFTAISLLEKARGLDPQSFEICYALAQAYQGNSVTNDKSIQLLTEASRMRADDLSLQSQLGRQYLAKSSFDKAIEHLRLAIQTTDYARDDDGAAVVDYFLARALQQRGYDRAALDRYAILLDRLQRPSFTIRSNPELGYLINRPELLFVQIGQLYQKHGNFVEALRVFELAAERDPGNFDLQQQIVRVKLGASDVAGARQRATAVVAKFRATSESLDLLREAYGKDAGETGVIDALRQLHESAPGDRALLFTLADVLRSEGRTAEAEQLLAGALQQSPVEKQKELVTKLVELKLDDNDVPAAAVLLLEAMARQPGMTAELLPVWNDMLRSGQKHRLRIATVEQLKVSPDAEPVRQYFISRMAAQSNRDLLVRASVEKAVQATSLYPPAYRLAINVLSDRPDLTLKQRQEASTALLERVEQAGQPALEAELRGLLAVQQSDYPKAVWHFSEAVRLGATDPATVLGQAAVLQASGDSARAEQTLWKLISDHPGFDEAYTMLIAHYGSTGAIAPAERVLNTWLGNEPSSVEARLIQAMTLLGRNQGAAAERMLLGLFTDHPDLPEVVSTLRVVFERNNHPDLLVKKLEELHTADPTNLAVLDGLVAGCIEAGREDDAFALIEQTRKAVSDDANLLYDMSHLYVEIERRDTCEEVLLQAIKVDPQHAAANNDLGYTWADAGTHLDRAEAMCRLAVELEPDNSSYLDSLGWVLYKRSKFDEARVYFDRAITPSAQPDPIVLDHLGDVLYRLGDKTAAGKLWQNAKDRLAETGVRLVDHQVLVGSLERKLQQHQRRQPVDVAPIDDKSIPQPGRAQR